MNELQASELADRIERGQLILEPRDTPRYVLAAAERYMIISALRSREGQVENERLRAILGKAYQYISPYSDPMPITAGSMASEIMTALSASPSPPVEAGGDAAADMLAALKEAIEFQNEDTECLASQQSSGGPDVEDEREQCSDRRCYDHGCMVARVNRWREAIAKATASPPPTDLVEASHPDPDIQFQRDHALALARQSGWCEGYRAAKAGTDLVEVRALALRDLVERLEYIHEQPEFISVWTIHQLHCGPYTGPTYEKELEAAKLALASNKSAVRGETLKDGNNG